MPRYGANDDSLRIDAPNPLEEPAPLRTIGPVRAVTTPLSTTVPAPFSVGQDTGCANAALRVSGGGHFTTVLGVGICPPNVTPGNAWINNQLVVGTDPGGTEALRVGGRIRSNDRILVDSTGTPLYQWSRSGVSVGSFEADAAGQLNLFLGGTEATRWTNAAVTPGAAGGLTLGTKQALPWGDTNIGVNLNFHTAATLRFSLASTSIDNLFFLDSAGATAMQLGTVALVPGAAAGRLFGSTALPWGIGHFQDEVNVWSSVAGAQLRLVQHATDAHLINAANTPLFFYTNNTSRWEILATGHFVAVTDNTYDIGASGANRPRDAFLARKLTTVDSNRFNVDDGSTNKAGVGAVVVSTSAASGDYPEGTIWCKV